MSEDDEEISPTERVLRELRVRIHLSKWSQRQIEERLGFSRGHLSQLLGGFVDMKLYQVLAVLHVLQIDPGDFFRELFPRHRNPVATLLEDYRRHVRRSPEGGGDEQRLSLELARLYGYGIESVTDFQERLERCEEALDELSRLGLLNEEEE